MRRVRKPTKSWRNLLAKSVRKVRVIRKKLVDIKEEIHKRDEQWATKFDKVCSRVSEMEKNLAGQSATIKSLIRNEVANLEKHPSPTLNSSLENQILKCTSWLEKQEKERRKLNIVIKGLEVNTDNLLVEVNTFFPNVFVLNNIISSCRIINVKGKFILATVMNWNSKLEIMKTKSTKLRNTGTFIENDLTPSERTIDYGLRLAAKKERAAGKTVRLGYQKIQLDGIWYPWDKASNEVAKSPLFTDVSTDERPRSFADAASTKN